MAMAGDARDALRELIGERIQGLFPLGWAVHVNVDIQMTPPESLPEHAPIALTEDRAKADGREAMQPPSGRKRSFSQVSGISPETHRGSFTVLNLRENMSSVSKQPRRKYSPEEHERFVRNRRHGVCERCKRRKQTCTHNMQSPKTPDLSPVALHSRSRPIAAKEKSTSVDTSPAAFFPDTTCRVEDLVPPPQHPTRHARTRSQPNNHLNAPRAPGGGNADMNASQANSIFPFGSQAVPKQSGFCFGMFGSTALHSRPTYVQQYTGEPPFHWEIPSLQSPPQIEYSLGPRITHNGCAQLDNVGDPPTTGSGLDGPSNFPLQDPTGTPFLSFVGYSDLVPPLNPSLPGSDWPRPYSTGTDAVLGDQVTFPDTPGQSSQPRTTD
ncbi:hypothetical protein BDY21DRAFT_204684 [Lineolata rhizophorae]|uniref:Zn(2)-C6 fungal-type domain-containing protein n=1 Tax=Lineolata rhizophorae TaxID=578093 RepID=A0A6A6P403_9PEZI|nr:hypothetical protein BDY21DRAFT_204684 [Lineolata rhizophorae]